MGLCCIGFLSCNVVLVAFLVVQFACLRQRELRCFALIVFLLSCSCLCSMSRWSVVCDCGLDFGRIHLFLVPTHECMG